MNINDLFKNSNKKQNGGNYGFDRFSKFLLIVSIIFLTNKWTGAIGVFLLIVVIFRYFSQNKYKRHLEEMAYEQWINRIKYDFNTKINKLKDRKTHVIKKCPNCGQKLRLPRGKGKIVVTCKACGKEFKART